MESFFLCAGIALCLFSLWALGRNDWVRLNTLSRDARATVVGHVRSESDGSPTYAARLRFSAEGKEHEVTDQVHTSRPRPPEGTVLTVRYPVARPDLARIPRPWMWAGIYALLIGLAGVLGARLEGWIGG